MAHSDMNQTMLKPMPVWIGNISSKPT
jgi:hypothetical protein